MKKYIILIIIAIIIFFITFLSFSNNSKATEEENIITENENNIIEEDTENVEQEETEEEEYKELKISSSKAEEIIDFVPKYFQHEVDRMNNEYVIFVAISALINDSDTAEEYYEFKYEEVLNKAKNIYGEDIEIEKSDNYNYPIGYKEENDTFHILPFGIGGEIQQYVGKSLVESDKEFVLELYIVNISFDYSSEDTNLLIETKDTFKQRIKDRNDFEEMESTYIVEPSNNEDIDITRIVEDYKEKLPTVKYTLIKKDERGKEYYIDNIDVIY